MDTAAIFQYLYPRYSKPLAAIVAVTGHDFAPDALDPDLFTEHVRHAAACLRLFPDHTLFDYAARLDLAVDALTVATYEPDPAACAALIGESCKYLDALSFAAGILGT